MRLSATRLALVALILVLLWSGSSVVQRTNAQVTNGGSGGGGSSGSGNGGNGGGGTPTTPPTGSSSSATPTPTPTPSPTTTPPPPSSGGGNGTTNNPPPSSGNSTNVNGTTGGSGSGGGGGGGAPFTVQPLPQGYRVTDRSVFNRADGIAPGPSSDTMALVGALTLVVFTAYTMLV